MNFAFTLEAQPKDEKVTGELQLYELIIPDCAREGYEAEITEEPGGGASAPGCEGIDYEGVSLGSIGAAE